MSGTPFSPAAPVADNVMDIDSDPDAEQEAQELAQAQERVHIVNEARERRREEQKWKEEEEKEAQQIAAIEAAEKEVEEILEREWQAQLQVSTRFLQFLSCSNIAAQRDLEVSVMTPEPLLVPFIDKGKEVSTGVNSGVDTRTEN